MGLAWGGLVQEGWLAIWDAQCLPPQLDPFEGWLWLRACPPGLCLLPRSGAQLDSPFAPLARCLQNYIPPQSLTLSCPVCRQTSILPEKGVAALQNNFFITNLMEVLQRQPDSAGHEDAIAMLDSVSAVPGKPLSCPNHEGKVCVELALLGRISGSGFAGPFFHPSAQKLSLASGTVGGASTSLHSFPKPEGLPVGGSWGACPQGSHAGWGLGLKSPGLTNFPICPQTMEYYCEACETAMCHECTVGEHREHVTVPLRDVVEQHKASLRQQLDAIKSRYCPGGLPTAAGPARGLGFFYSAAQLRLLRGPPCLPACHS